MPRRLFAAAARRQFCSAETFFGSFFRNVLTNEKTKTKVPTFIDAAPAFQTDTKMISNISLTRQLPASLRGMRVAACPAEAFVSLPKPGQRRDDCERGHADERHDGSKTLAECGRM
jgi:hypothetical protein